MKRLIAAFDLYDALLEVEQEQEDDDIVEEGEYLVSTNYNTKVTMRVSFDPEKQKPADAIRLGASQAQEKMGWFDTRVMEGSEIHFHPGYNGTMYADVIYEERPVLREHYPGMRDDA